MKARYLCSAVAAADFLRNPDDPRDATSSRATVRVDQFMLKFVKP